MKSYLFCSLKERIAMSIRFKNVTKTCKNYKNIKKVYHTAFPAEERVPVWFLMAKSKGKNARFYSVYEKETWVGFVYLIKYQDIIYVFYLAVSEKERGGGYGSKILKKITDKYQEKRIILCIEPVDKNADNYEERVNRKNFYEKNGFYDLNYQISEKNVIYSAFGYGNKVSKKEYLLLIRNYFGKILFTLYYRKEASLEK